MDLVTGRPPASETAIAAVEAKIGARFPEDYRSFLLRHDGGRTREETEFDVPGGGVSPVSDFLSTDPDDDYYLLAGLEWHDENYPPGIWPIGDVGNGDQVVLAVSGAHAGGVLYFFHDRDAPQPISEAANLARLADSFTAFAVMQRAVAA